MSLDGLFDSQTQVEDITEIIFVLDCSGSMGSVVDATIAGFNKFIADQKTAPGKAYMTLATFSSDLIIVHDGVQLQNVPDLSRHTYQLRGNTALLDAIGQQIINTARRLAQMPLDRRPSKVIFAILTDGEENASRNFSAEDIRKMITEHEDIFEWDFLFLGANQDAFKVGAQYGIKAGKALSWSQSGSGVEGLFGAVSGSVRRYRESGAPADNGFFTEEDHQTQQNLGAAATPRSS